MCNRKKSALRLRECNSQLFLMFQTIVIVVISTLLLVGCSTSDNDDPDNGVQTNPTNTGSGNILSVKILDDFVNKQPLANVYVSLYNADNKTIAKTMMTNSNGIASFGEVANTYPNAVSADPGRVTVTVADQNASPDSAEIQTFFNVLINNYTLFRDDPGCNEKGKINVVFNNITAANLSGARLLPQIGNETGNALSAFSQVTNETASFNNVTVCQEEVQTDGKLSFVTGVYDQTGELVNYGYLLDQVFTSGSSYTGTADLSPTSLNWTANETVQSILIGATRKDVNYGLGVWTAQLSAAASSGTIQVADQFPADSYTLLTNRLEPNDNASIISQRRITSFPNNPVVELTDIRFSAFSYDNNPGAFDWTLIGNADKNYIEISAMFNAVKDVEWNLTLPPDFSTMTLPDLPAEVQAWFDRNGMVASSTEVSSNNIIGLNDYDSFITNLGAGSGTTILSFAGFDFSTRSLEGDGTNNGGGTGNGDYGSVTFSGAGANSFASPTFTPVNVNDTGVIGITWTDAAVNGTVILAMINPSDTTKLVLLSITAPDGTAWLSSVGSSGGVSGVTVSGKTINISNAVLTGASGSITMNGTLKY